MTTDNETNPLRKKLLAFAEDFGLECGAYACFHPDRRLKLSISARAAMEEILDSPLCQYNAISSEEKTEPTPDIAANPKVGDLWWVKFEGGEALRVLEVTDITAFTVEVLLHTPAVSRTPNRYKCGYLDFVELKKPAGA